MDKLDIIFKSNSENYEIPNTDIKLSPIEVDKNYREKWNIDSKDFVVLTRNGKLLRNTLYRLGGVGTRPDGQNYFMLLKYVEDFYEKRIVGDRDPKHLSSRWCIIDKYGEEKVEFEQFKSPYLVNNSCIYVLDGKYYNIETGEYYGIHQND